MSRATKSEPRFDNLGELLEKMTGLLSKLGGIPAGRVRLDPFPGTATKRDLVRFHSREDKLYELVDHTLVEKPMGSPESYLALRLGFLLQNYLAEHDSGFLYGADSLIEMLPDVVRGPDVCFVSWAKRPERTVPTEPISDLIPDLAVEVLSPSNTRGEILRKLKEYFLAGVQLVWVIDPLKRTADVHTAPDVKTSLDESGTLDGADVLPGFRLPLVKLFERLEKPKGKKPRKTK
jgi:Uma2 family endonuclease